MQSADLLAIAGSPAPNVATPASAAEDADVFARALENEVGRSRPVDDPRCGTTGQEAAGVRGDRGGVRDLDEPRGVRDGVRVPTAGADFNAWRSFIQGLRDLGVMPGGQAQAGPGRLTGRVAEPATATPKPATQNPFATALDALSEAINAAIQDPGANPAAPGQLPPIVQTALDAAIAAAPPMLQSRLQAFTNRLTERLATVMAGAGDGEGETAATAGTDKTARPAQSVAQAVMAALGQTGQTATPTMPELDGREARAAAAPPADAKAAPEAPAPAAATATTPAANDTAKAASAEAKPAPAEAAAEPLTPVAANDAGAPETAPQTATTAPTTAAAPTHAAAVTATRGAPELVAQMAATIGRKLQGGVTRFDMELNPAELGRVDVRLSIDKDGRVAAQMAFDNPVAAAEMRGKADELRRQLEQSGFQVASEDLTFTDRQTGQGGGQNGRGLLADPDVARDRAFREADRTARLAEDAGRLQNRAVIGLDMKV